MSKTNSHQQVIIKKQGDFFPCFILFVFNLWPESFILNAQNIERQIAGDALCTQGKLLFAVVIAFQRSLSTVLLQEMKIQIQLAS